MNGPPYTEYKSLKELEKEKGIQAAKLYMDTGILPLSLEWLERGKERKRKKDTIVEKKVLDPMSKKRLAVEMHKLKECNF